MIKIGRDKVILFNRLVAFLFFCSDSSGIVFNLCQYFFGRFGINGDQVGAYKIGRGRGMPIGEQRNGAGGQCGHMAVDAVGRQHCGRKCGHFAVIMPGRAVAIHTAL